MLSSSSTSPRSFGPSVPSLSSRPTFLRRGASAEGGGKVKGKPDEAKGDKEEEERPLEVHPTFGEHADYRGTVVVKVEKSTFYVHKDVVYFIPFFQSILDGDWQESHPSLRSSIASSKAFPFVDTGEERGRSDGSEDETSDLASHIVGADWQNDSIGHSAKGTGAVTVGPSSSKTVVDGAQTSSPSDTAGYTQSGRDEEEAEDCDEVSRLEERYRRLISLATPPGSPSGSPTVHISPDGDGDMERKDGLVTDSNEADPGSRGKLRAQHKGRVGDKKVDAIVHLEEEKADIFQDFLFFLYPHLDLQVTWYNVAGLLHMSDKFDVPLLRRQALNFLTASAAGRPIQAMAIAERYRLNELYRDASRHVLDNYSSWEMGELAMLSKETLLKLERKRTWFLERLLKLGLTTPARDYICVSSCPDPIWCARMLDEKWKTAYQNTFKFGPPQPSMIYRYLRELEISPPLPHTACQHYAKVWILDLFDRMFQISQTGKTPRQFLNVRL